MLLPQQPASVRAREQEAYHTREHRYQLMRALRLLRFFEHTRHSIALRSPPAAPLLRCIIPPAPPLLRCIIQPVCSAGGAAGAAAATEGGVFEKILCQVWGALDSNLCIATIFS